MGAKRVLRGVLGVVMVALLARCQYRPSDAYCDGERICSGEQSYCSKPASQCISPGCNPKTGILDDEVFKLTPPWNQKTDVRRVSCNLGDRCTQTGPDPTKGSCRAASPTDGGTPPDMMPPQPTCSDGALNGTETDVDCGGLCPKCADNKICAAAADCQSNMCVNTQCKACERTKIPGSMDQYCGPPVDQGGCEMLPRCSVNTFCKTDAWCAVPFICRNKGSDDAKCGDV